MLCAPVERHKASAPNGRLSARNPRAIVKMMSGLAVDQIGRPHTMGGHTLAAPIDGEHVAAIAMEPPAAHGLHQ